MNQKIHRIGAIAVLAISFGVFLKTVAPTLSFWDCGEFIACSYTLGVPHPPGSPLYLLLGRLFTFLPIGDDPAFPVNLMSVISSALATMLVYLITVRLIVLVTDKSEGGGADWGRDLPALVGGMTAALMMAFSDTFWFNAVEAEVYGFSMLLMALSVWLGLRWMDRARRPANARLLYFVAYLMGLAGGLHLLCLLAVPTLAVLIWSRDRSALRDPKLWAITPLLFALGYSTYLALMIRSGLDPVIDENNPENWANFMMFLSREQYGAESMFLRVFDRRAPFWDYQLGSMYLKYFLAQFPVPGLRFLSEAFRKATQPETLRIHISIVPYVLGFCGMWLHWRRDGRRFWALLVLFALTGVGLSVYLNMPDPQPRERDYAFVGSFAVFAIWIGIAVSGAVEWVRNRRMEPFSLVLSAVFLAMPLSLVATQYHTHDRTGSYVAYDYGHNILTSCDPDAMLITNGDNDTFPLWFLQEVMGIRRDVRVVNLSLLNTSWYIKQLRDVAPTLPIRYSDDYIDRVLTAFTRSAVVNSGRLWPEDREVTAAGMTWTLPASPRSILRIQDVMVLKLIDWIDWERPIYFSTTVPDNNLLSLKAHLQMEGMVYRLHREASGLVHPERTRRNLLETYAYRGLDDPAVYRDGNTLNLLVNYLAAFLQLAEAYRIEGRIDEALALMRFCEERAVPPEAWEGHLLLAAETHRLGAGDEALRLVDRALAAPSTDETRQRGAAAEMLMGLKAFERAEAIYTEMLERDMDSHISLFNRAVARERMGKLEDALADLTALARLVPDDAEVRNAIGMIRQRVETEKADGAKPDSGAAGSLP